MRNAIYTVAVILGILWAIAYFGYNYGGAIHFLLVIAIFVFFFELMRKKNIK